MATPATSTEQDAGQKAKSTAGAADPAVKRNQRRKSRSEHRKKMSAKLHTDKEFAKTFFEARSKRANDKKAAFRKKKNRKK